MSHLVLCCDTDSLSLVVCHIFLPHVITTQASEDAVRQEEAKARFELLQEENLILQRKIRECTIECDKLESEMESKRYC